MTNLKRLLFTLAIWGEADSAALFRLNANITHPDLALLADHPEIQTQDEVWRMDPLLATRLLAELAQQSPTDYRHWHDRALAYAGDQLRQGDSTWEKRFILLLDRFATYLAQPDPKWMGNVVQAALTVPLHTPLAQQTRGYLQGLVCLRQDHHAQALAIFNELLATPDLDSRVRMRTLNSQAVSYETIGQWQEAMQGYRLSLAFARQLGDRLSEGKALQNLGALACQFREYAEAEHTLLAAMACFEETQATQSIAAVHNELGLIYLDQGRWAEALHAFQLCADYQRQQGAQDALAGVLTNIGEVLLFQGRLVEAEQNFQDALVLMQTRASTVDIDLNLGLVRQVNDDLTGALTAYKNALDTALAIGRRDILAEIYYRLGEVARLQGAQLLALTQYELAAQVIENTREPIQDEGLKISLLGRWQQIYEALVLHCWQMNRPAAAWQWAERARARAFAEQMTLAQVQAVPPENATNLDKSGTDALPTTAVITLEELQARVPTNAVVFNYFTTGVFDNHSPFLRLLAHDNPLRVHLLTPAYTLLFVIRAQNITIHHCPIDPNAFLSTSRRAEDRSRYLTPTMLRQLHQRLLPAVALKSAQRLYLIPHGPLHYVPFAALVDADGQALVRPHGPELLYAPSATILYQQWLTNAVPCTAEKTLLAIGYDSTVSSGRLRHTESEAQLIATMTNGVAWVGAQPKCADLQIAAPSYRWLHFACHGWFDYEKPLQSYVQTGENEQLTAEEVLRDWRIVAELVTLSACQTGVHRLLRGDEPMGLIRGFLAAGARAVLATQWPVEDFPTFLFMSHFYQALSNSPQAHAAAALGATQLWLRNLSEAEIQKLLTTLGTVVIGEQSGLTGDYPFAHPRFWASFVLFGG